MGSGREGSQKKKYGEDEDVLGDIMIDIRTVRYYAVGFPRYQRLRYVESVDLIKVFISSLCLLLMTT